jgi:hypothetical protein
MGIVDANAQQNAQSNLCTIYHSRITKRTEALPEGTGVQESHRSGGTTSPGASRPGSLVLARDP